MIGCAPGAPLVRGDSMNPTPSIMSKPSASGRFGDFGGVDHVSRIDDFDTVDRIDDFGGNGRLQRGVLGRLGRIGIRGPGVVAPTAGDSGDEGGCDDSRAHAVPQFGGHYDRIEAFRAHVPGSRVRSMGRSLRAQRGRANSRASGCRAR